MSRTRFYTAIFITAATVTGFSSADVGNLVIEAEEEEEIIIVEEEPTAATVDARQARPSEEARDEEKGEKPARASKPKRSSC